MKLVDVIADYVALRQSLGYQCRLRQLLYQMRVCPQWSHCSTWPPSAAVRHCVIAVRTRRCVIGSDGPMWSR